MNRKDQERLRPTVAKARKELLQELKSDRNILGAGFGQRTRRGVLTDTPALVVYVSRKVRGDELPDAQRLPRDMRVDGQLIDVDVVETGPFAPQAYLERVRPARWGCSIRHDQSQFRGTLGAVGLYRPNNRLGILSNNHVIARSTSRPNNDESPGSPRKFDPIVQPHTGTAILDTICWLECWVPLQYEADGGSNRVDAALAYEDPGGMLINEAMGGWPVVTPSTPGVGLLFAGSPSRTIHNRMTEVLTLLPFSFLPTNQGSMVANAYIGQIVQKTGATTEHTVGRVMEVDVTVRVERYVTVERGVQNCVFTGQIATTPMSAGGDSGSVTMEGGDPAGVVEPVGGLNVPIYDPCGTVLAVDLALGVPLVQDDPVLRQARDKYLRQTLVGSYIVDLFYRNEAAFRARVERTQVSEADRKLAQALYSSHVGDLKYALANPDTGARLGDEGLVDLAVATRELAKYQSADEQRAAAEVLDIARSLEGKTLSEILVVLNDEALLRRLRSILGGVSSIDTD